MAKKPAAMFTAVNMEGSRNMPRERRRGGWA